MQSNHEEEGAAGEVAPPTAPLTSCASEESVSAWELEVSRGAWGAQASLFMFLPQQD